MIIDLIDNLADRAIQLITYKQQMRAVMLKTYVTPVFSEFEHVHSAYLESFSRYRDLIQNSNDLKWIDSLQAVLEKDNLFSANCRAKVFRLAEAENNDLIGMFVKGIYGYLVGARLVKPLGKEIHPLEVQVWRQSLRQTLSEISDERWQMVIDPDGARPPLSKEEIRAELEQISRKYSTYGGGKTNKDKLKRACALNSLDDIVMEMQNRYDQVCKEYVKLKTHLSK